MQNRSLEAEAMIHPDDLPHDHHAAEPKVYYFDEGVHSDF